MSKEQAEKAGLYPYIYYGNFATNKWIAEIHGGRLATEYELFDMVSSTMGRNNLVRFAAIGQAPFFGQYVDGMRSHDTGYWVQLGSSTIYNNPDDAEDTGQLR